MSIFIPGRTPPLPTSHRPPPQHRSRRPVHRVAHAPSREASKHADGWRSWSYLSTLKLAKKKTLIASVTSSPPPLVAKVGSHLHRRAALVGGSEHAAGGRRSVYLPCSVPRRAQVGDDRAIYHALCCPQRLWALGSTREKSSSRLAPLPGDAMGRGGAMDTSGAKVGVERIVAT